MKLQIFVFVSCVLAANALSLFGESRIEPLTEKTTQCEDYAAWGWCQFYQCLEDRFPCGHDGFTLRYMKYFCDRGVSNMPNFNHKGQRWLNRTALCMAENVLPEYNAHINRCGDIKRAGIAGMLACNALVDETGTDICDVVTENFGAYRDMFGTEGFSRIMSLGNARMTGAFIYDLGRCGAGELQERVTNLAQQIEGIFETAFAAIVDRWNRFWN